jgi:hypothetical protein
MPLFWLIVTPIAIVVAVITLVDVLRRPYGGWLKAGWVLAVVILPIVGSLIYWATRRYSPEEADEAYLAEADMRRESANRFYDV